MLILALAMAAPGQCRQTQYFADGRVETSMVDDDVASTAQASSRSSGSHSSSSYVSASSSSNGTSSASSTSSADGKTRSVSVKRDANGCTITIDERPTRE
ncbi:hypothetical protein F1C10_07790 [Sphingomonas sp. NBWT7]|uniref:hypothetical protein n=1 Tax=Sphingomonas sp. NBWT7 TaxID=2596913 RepID=UPI001627BDFE|nr:hypothetical protein [Sphingomonas sp. NBWT7]QNE31843.1 hypothetical protein F1C10_07790 [Sphingomonas sp. NBWT7]